MSLSWGLNLKPNHVYIQTKYLSYHISGMCINEGNHAKIYITTQFGTFVLANLDMETCPQVQLDLILGYGDCVKFENRGDATVAITGYHLTACQQPRMEFYQVVKSPGISQIFGKITLDENGDEVMETSAGPVCITKNSGKTDNQKKEMIAKIFKKKKELEEMTAKNVAALQAVLDKQAAIKAAKMNGMKSRPASPAT